MWVCGVLLLWFWEVIAARSCVAGSGLLVSCWAYTFGWASDKRGCGVGCGIRYRREVMMVIFGHSPEIDVDSRIQHPFVIMSCIIIQLIYSQYAYQSQYNRVTRRFDPVTF